MVARLEITPNGKKILSSIRRTDEKTVKGIRRAFYEIGKRLKSSANESILRGQKTGRTYVVTSGSVRRRHKTSSSGQAWANISGKARRSIGYQVSGADSLRFTGGGSNAPYVKYLEEGTSKMSPRPAMRNAISDQTRNIVKYIGNFVVKEVKKT